MDPRAVKKLLDNLRNDPQLRAEDDPTIVAEEQYPMAHHPIFGACIEKTKLHEITTMLQWKREHNAHNLPESSLKELKLMKDSLKKVFLLDLKINAPWEEMKFTAWRYKVTNIVISAVHVALKAEDDGEAVKHLFGTGKHSNPSITAGEKRNIQGHLIYNPLVLDDPWDEPDDLDGKIITLLEEREPYLTSLARQSPYRDSDEFPREVDIAKNKLIALGSSLFENGPEEDLQNGFADLSRVAVGFGSRSENPQLAYFHQNQGSSESASYSSKRGEWHHAGKASFRQGHLEVYSRAFR